MIVETAEFHSQAAKALHKGELRPDVILDEAKTKFLHELEVILGFALYFGKVVSGCQHVLDYVIATEARMRNVTALVCNIECAAHEIAARADMLRPRQDDISE